MSFKNVMITTGMIMFGSGLYLIYKRNFRVGLPLAAVGNAFMTRDW